MDTIDTAEAFSILETLLQFAASGPLSTREFLNAKEALDVLKQAING